MGLYSNLAKPTGAANMRGAVDFSDVGAFTLAEKGHSLLAVLDTPNVMKLIAHHAGQNGGDSNLKTVIDNFPIILESEFKGLDGLDGMTSNTLEISDNISTLNVLGTVEYPTNQEITMRFTEKAGRTITKYCSTYLRALRDPRTRAKTYLGYADAVNGADEYVEGKTTSLRPSLKHEIFTFLYIVMDNTWSVVENAYLLANAQITKAGMDALDNFDKGDISLAEIDIPFNTFVITENETVYKVAQEFLTSYVERKSYDATKWNVNSEKLDYKVFSNVFKTDSTKSGANKYNIATKTAGGAGTDTTQQEQNTATGA